MFLLLTDYHSTKKVLINLDDVRRIDVFQEAFARLTFKDKEVFDTSESFDSVCQLIYQDGYLTEYAPPDPAYVTHAQEYASRIVNLPQTFSPDFNAPAAKPFFPDEIPPDINDIPKRD